MATYRRCRHCRQFFDKKNNVCDHCGGDQWAANKWLVTAALNNSLYQQAARNK